MSWPIKSAAINKPFKKLISWPICQEAQLARHSQKVKTFLALTMFTRFLSQSCLTTRPNISHFQSLQSTNSMQFKTVNRRIWRLKNDELLGREVAFCSRWLILTPQASPIYGFFRQCRVWREKGKKTCLQSADLIVCYLFLSPIKIDKRRYRIGLQKDACSSLKVLMSLPKENQHQCIFSG